MTQFPALLNLLAAASTKKSSSPVFLIVLVVIAVAGYFLFLKPQQRKAAAEINRWLARGKLRPQIDRVMKLSEAAEAHTLTLKSQFSSVCISFARAYMEIPD